jgi:hypothetical protein
MNSLPVVNSVVPYTMLFGTALALAPPLIPCSRAIIRLVTWTGTGAVINSCDHRNGKKCVRACACRQPLFGYLVFYFLCLVFFSPPRWKITWYLQTNPPAAEPGHPGAGAPGPVPLRQLLQALVRGFPLAGCVTRLSYADHFTGCHQIEACFDLTGAK